MKSVKGVEFSKVIEGGGTIVSDDFKIQNTNNRVTAQASTEQILNEFEGLIGVSISRCLPYIVRQKIPLDKISMIIGNTAFQNKKAFENELENSYPADRNVWFNPKLTDEELKECIKVGLQLRDDGKIKQYRTHKDYDAEKFNSTDIKNLGNITFIERKYKEDVYSSKILNLLNLQT